MMTAMNWFNKLFHRVDVQALAKEVAKMALDFSKLQSDVAAQSTLITQVQTEVATLQAAATSSAEQSTVDGIAASVVSNNTVLQSILTPTST